MAKPDKDRFVVVQYQRGGIALPGFSVVMDRMTGVQYLYANWGHGGGMTVLVDRDGKPLLYQPPGSSNGFAFK